MILAACAPSAAVPLESPTPQPQQDTFPASASFRYVAVGASDSVGVGASDPARKSWPALLAARMPARTAYLNLGVSGSTVAQALVEQLPDAVSHQADVLTVWLAFNDLASGVDPSAYRADLSRLLDALLRENRGLIFVANLPDLRRVAAPSGVDRNAVATVVERYNATIADVVRSRAPRTILVDLFTGSEEVIATQLVVSADGLHPNDLGYARIAERFAEVMRRAGVPLR
jgi:lysophospholipase L1-like esterase